MLLDIDIHTANSASLVEALLLLLLFICQIYLHYLSDFGSSTSCIAVPVSSFIRILVPELDVAVEFSVYWLWFI